MVFRFLSEKTDTPVQRGGKSGQKSQGWEWWGLSALAQAVTSAAAVVAVIVVVVVVVEN